MVFCMCVGSLQSGISIKWKLAICAAMSAVFLG